MYLVLFGLCESDALKLVKVQNSSLKQVDFAEQSKELTSIYQTAQSYISEVLSTDDDESLSEKVDSLLQADTSKDLYDSISKWNGIEARLSEHLMKQLHSKGVSRFTVKTSVIVTHHEQSMTFLSLFALATGLICQLSVLFLLLLLLLYLISIFLFSFTYRRRPLRSLSTP